MTISVTQRLDDRVQRRMRHVGLDVSLPIHIHRACLRWIWIHVGIISRLSAGKAETTRDIRDPLEYLAGSRLDTNKRIASVIGNSQRLGVNVYSPGWVVPGMQRPTVFANACPCSLFRLSAMEAVEAV